MTKLSKESENKIRRFIDKQINESIKRKLNESDEEDISKYRLYTYKDSQKVFEKSFDKIKDAVDYAKKTGKTYSVRIPNSITQSFSLSLIMKGDPKEFDEFDKTMKSL
ncbi:hypothetical protein MEO93_20905 [Dolichospermum sp. ST_sed3]|nr:hypothetical protein [Dolichospermum sp. ST_sed3]